jgi:thiol-disulfide isomerase/thioredoxin
MAKLPCNFSNKFIMKNVFVFAGILVGLYGNAQRISQGGKYPDEMLHHVFNYTNDSLKLSQFKKKLVILDMWDIHCASCIAAFPKINELQKQFDNDIQIVMVNKQSKDSTLQFFAKRKKIKLPGVPFITADKKLNEYFPYSGYPYHVWIDGGQKVHFVTESYNATPEHIRDFLEGKKLMLDSLIARNYLGPLLRSGNQAWIEQVSLYSLISKCTKGLNVGHVNGGMDGNKVRMSSNCSSIAELYRLAYEEGSRYNFGLPVKMVIQLPETYAYVRPKDGKQLDEWEKEHSYNYELVLPEENKEKLHDYMKQDLERYFGIRGEIEKRKINGLVLIRTSTEDKLKTKGGRKEDRLSQGSNGHPVTDTTRYLTNTDFRIFRLKLKAWVEHASGLPFKDETDYEGNIDLAIRGDAYDSNNVLLLKNALQPYDLDIVSKEIEVDVLVLKPINYAYKN